MFPFDWIISVSVDWWSFAPDWMQDAHTGALSLIDRLTAWRQRHCRCV